MKRRVISILMVTAMAASLVACSSEPASGTGGSEAAAEVEEGVFNVAIQSDIDTFDPAQCNAYGTELVVNNVYDNLFKFDTKDSSFQPNLATGYEQVDDLTYVITLRDDVKFWDGNPMTADDVVYSMNRHMDPEVASLFEYMYYPVESVEATGDYEVTVHLKYADCDFIYNLATMAGAVLEKSFVEEAGAAYGSAKGGVMGTGPYMYTSWTEGAEIVLTKNDNYWQDVTYPEDVLEFDIIADSATQAMSAASGAIDFINLPSLDQMDQVKDSDSVNISYSAGVQNSYIAFNCSYGPFSDPNVRKAAACAIDDDAIALATKGEGHYETAKAIDYNTDEFAYYNDDWAELNDSLDSYDYDVEKAKEYLAESSYPDGFECAMPTCGLFEKEAQAVQYYLGQIGITVNLETVTISDYYQYAYGVMQNDEGYRDYDLISFAWFPDYADPSAYLMIYYGENAGIGGSNISAYVNKDFDALYEAAKGQSGDERNETLKEAYSMVVDDCAADFICYNGPSAAVNSAYSVDMPAMWFWNFQFTQVTKN